MERLLVCAISGRRRFWRMALATLWTGCEVLAGQDDKAKAKDAKAAPVVYTPGGDVKPPKVIHYVEPDFSQSSKEAFIDGIVKLKTTVTPEGRPSDIEVVKGLKSDEDKTAVDAVKQWRFQPGTKGGEAVYVRVSIEIAFHLM